MFDARKVIIGIVIFLVLLTFPSGTEGQGGPGAPAEDRNPGDRPARGEEMPRADRLYARQPHGAHRLVEGSRGSGRTAVLCHFFGKEGAMSLSRIVWAAIRTKSSSATPATTTPR